MVLPRPDWLFRLDDQAAGVPRDLAAGIRARVFTGTNLQLSVVRFEPHATGTIHGHPEEQWGLLLEGECVRVQGGVEVPVRAGDFWHTPGGVLHGIRTGDLPALVLDVFSPVRQAYRTTGSGFAEAERQPGRGAGSAP
jgi:quercetin dioxygenase-like cupin family protein